MTTQIIEKHLLIFCNLEISICNLYKQPAVPRIIPRTWPAAVPTRAPLRLRVAIIIIIMLAVNALARAFSFSDSGCRGCCNDGAQPDWACGRRGARGGRMPRATFPLPGQAIATYTAAG